MSSSTSPIKKETVDPDLRQTFFEGQSPTPVNGINDTARSEFFFKKTGSDSIQNISTNSERTNFRFLPPASDDFNTGLRFYIVGSLVAAVAPCFPLTNMYVGEVFWISDNLLSKSHYTIVYSLLSAMGVVIAFMCYLILRIANARPTAIDSVFVRWLLALGVAPSVPATYYLLWHHPKRIQFFAALIVCTFATMWCIINATFTMGRAPVDRSTSDNNIMAVTTVAHRCWLLFAASLSAACVCTGMLVNQVINDHPRFNLLVFGYSVGLLVSLLFTTGSMYTVAGCVVPEAVAGPSYSYSQINNNSSGHNNAQPPPSSPSRMERGHNHNQQQSQQQSPPFNSRQQARSASSSSSSESDDLRRQHTGESSASTGAGTGFRSPLSPTRSGRWGDRKTYVSVEEMGTTIEL